MPRAYYETAPAPELVAALHDVARQNNLDIATLIQGAWALLLSRYGGETDVAFGMLVSHTPILTHATVHPEQAARAWLTALPADSATARQPEPSHLETLLIFGTHAEGAYTTVPFIITVDGPLRLHIDYDAARFEAAAIARLAGHLLTLLEGLVATPELSLKALPMLTGAERQQMLVAWNDTATDTGYTGQCIHRRFERQAAQRPDAVAVVYAEPEKPRQTLTYHALNARANQLARHLRTLGVGPEVPVAMCVTRSTAMLVGMLGILKAGGAYVPIDPAYPQERLVLMIDDTQAPVILTHTRLVGKLPAFQGHIVTVARASRTRVTAAVMTRASRTRVTAAVIARARRPRYNENWVVVRL